MQGAYGPGGDVDGDELGDYCEGVMAQQFTPVLKFHVNEQDAGRETYWAVRPMPNPYVYYLTYPGTAGPTVMIYYALGYYRDGGADWGACVVHMPWCDPHLGDSEAISLLLSYNASNKHWVLQDADLSEHDVIASFHADALSYSTCRIHEGVAEG
jgi:hypothetical protein